MNIEDLMKNWFTYNKLIIQGVEVLFDDGKDTKNKQNGNDKLIIMRFAKNDKRNRPALCHKIMDYLKQEGFIDVDLMPKCVPIKFETDKNRTITFTEN